ncbi:MAG: hypothetical protein ACFFB0_22535 [Promethearchaeota archaeon]
MNGTLAYLADYEKGLIIVNIADLSHPIKSAQFFDGGHVYDLDFRGNLVYVADSDKRLEIIEILI